MSTFLELQHLDSFLSLPMLTNLVYCFSNSQPSVRKTHNGGRKHKENVRFYYTKWMEEQAQSLIDQTSMHFTLTSIYLRDNYFSQKLLCAHDVSATLESRNWIIIWLSTNYIKKTHWNTPKVGMKLICIETFKTPIVRKLQNPVIITYLLNLFP